MSLEQIDPECRPALEALRSGAIGDQRSVTLEERRSIMSAMEAQMAASTPTPTNVTIEDRTIPGHDGAPEIPIRIYRPTGVTGAAPGVYYIHGGGMVVGDLDSGTVDCLRFSSQLGAVVVNVGYRLAPEHPHPAPGEDCYAGLVWMFANAEALALDTGRVAIYGPSAGGGLAAATALRARDLGGPQVRLVMAIYPMLDHRNITPSSHQITDVGVYDRDANIESWGLYLGGQQADAYAAPVMAENLTGYPPTYIDVGTQDVFRDEDITFASNLLAAGVPVELHVHPGAFHGSELLTPAAAVSQRQLKRRMEALHEALSVAHPPAAGALAVRGIDRLVPYHLQFAVPHANAVEVAGKGAVDH
jgi:acetyl esterase/lipase